MFKLNEEMDRNIFLECVVPLYKKQRLVAYFKNKKFVDCTFKIQGVEIKAHKLILACSSPVFERMFFGDLASSEVIISDANYEEFNQVLEYIYTENIAIASQVNAWNLYYIGNKYLLDDLIQVCLIYIKKNLTLSNLVLSYEFADMYNLVDIKEKCFSDMVNYVNGVLSSDYHMKSSTILSLLQNMEVSFDKFELTVKIINWAMKECEFRKMVVTPENIVDILKEENILSLIKKEWIIIFKCSDCSDPLILCQCMDKIVHKTILLLDDTLVWFKELPDEKKFCKPIPNICECRKEFKIACRIDLQQNEELISNIRVNRPAVIFGVLVNAVMNPEKYIDCSYEGSITVRFCKQYSDTNLEKPTIFEGVIYYNSNVYIPLKHLVTLEPHVHYDLRISYRNYGNLGFTPIHCYYMNDTLMNNNKDLIVTFFEMSGTAVKGLAFYAA